MYRLITNKLDEQRRLDISYKILHGGTVQNDDDEPQQCQAMAIGYTIIITSPVSIDVDVSSLTENQ